MYYLKSEHMICFDKATLKKIYEDEMRAEMIKNIAQSGYTSEELNSNIRKIQEIVDVIKKKTLEDKTAIEIFTALYCVVRFYGKESKLCFVLKNNFYVKKTPIRSFIDLKKAIRQDQEIDFGVLSKDGLRQFQQKQYRGKANTVELFDFLKDKLNHYGNNLENTNLLVILQCPGQDFNQIDFDELTQKLKILNLVYQGEILITFNVENKFIITERIYPERGIAKTPLILPSQQP